MLHEVSLFPYSRQVTSFVELLQLRAQYQPEQDAYIFCRDQGDEERLTYFELHQRACLIASQLQQARVAPGERALLLYGQGLDYISAFLGCLYARVIAVPAPHPHLAGISRYLARLHSIVDDAQPRVVLTDARLFKGIQPMLPEYPGLKDLEWVTIDTLPPLMELAWCNPQVQGQDLAFLQYTSGSASLPKGVMLTHENLLCNNALLQEKLQHPFGASFVGWIPLYHDMGMIATALQALYVGAPCVLMTPQAFIQKPVRWLEAISTHCAYTSFSPNFAFDLCIRKVTPEQRAQLDLSSWKCAMNGAEPVRAQTLKKFADAFAVCGFRPEYFAPSYGMAEASVFVCSPLPGEFPVITHVDASALEKNRVVPVEAEAPDSRALVGHGWTGSYHSLAIVDPVTYLRCAPGQVGEIWFQGPSVGQGYWNNPVATAATFQAFLADTGDGPFLRTGDLGFSLDGQLYITGRLKDIIIIDGRNHYPQDIELTVEQCHPAIRPAYTAAFAVSLDERDQLVIVAELERHWRPGSSLDARDLSDLDDAVKYRSIIRAIRRSVSEEHDLPIHTVVLLKPATIHKTSSGKIQRSACRRSFLDNTLEVWGKG